jgi:hypothetical protein
VIVFIIAMKRLRLSLEKLKTNLGRSATVTKIELHHVQAKWF